MKNKNKYKPKTNCELCAPIVDTSLYLFQYFRMSNIVYAPALKATFFDTDVMVRMPWVRLRSSQKV